MSIVSSFSHKQKTAARYCAGNYMLKVFDARGFVLAASLIVFVAGVELLPANTIIPIHPIKHPLQSLVVQSSPLSQSATYPASISIGRIYERPGANIADKDHTVKGPQKIS